MSHLKSSKKTLTNTDYIHNIKNSTIRENIYNNRNNNYKLCNNTLLNSKNFVNPLENNKFYTTRRQDISKLYFYDGSLYDVIKMKDELTKIK